MSSTMDEYHLSVKDDQGTSGLSLNLTRTGLAIHKLTIRSDRLAQPRDVVCGPEESSALEAEGRKFMNQVVGRYSNRLPAGKTSAFDLAQVPPTAIGLELEPNETFQAQPAPASNCLHSGSDGYDLRAFARVADDHPIVQRFESASQHGLVTRPRSDADDPRSWRLAYYHLHSPSGDQGFPEPIDVLATVTLDVSSAIGASSAPTQADPQPRKTRIGRLGFSLRAKISDSDPDGGRGDDRPTENRPGRGTPINLTWHTGYTLNDYQTRPADPNRIHLNKLWINSDHFLDVDRFQLPTGKIKPNRSAGIEFADDETGRVPPKDGHLKRIQDTMPDAGFDHCFLFPGSPSSLAGPQDDDYTKPKAILQSPKDDLQLVFYSNQSAVQCYSANYFDGCGSRKKLHSNLTNHQGGYQKQEAIYLEFQEPSSVCTNLKLQENLKSFGDKLKYNDAYSLKGISNTILYPDQVYCNWFMIDIFI